MKTDSKTSRLDTVAFVWRKTKLWAGSYQLLADDEVVGNQKWVSGERFWHSVDAAEFQLPVGLLRVGQTGSVWRKSAITFTLTDASGNTLLSGTVKVNWLGNLEITMQAAGVLEADGYVYKATNLWRTQYAWFRGDEKLLEVRKRSFSLTLLEARVLNGPLPAPVAWTLLSLSLYHYLLQQQQS